MSKTKEFTRVVGNPGHLIGFQLARVAGNPGKKGSHMAKTKKKATSYHKPKGYRAATKPNPFGHSHKPASKKRRGNPGALSISGAGDLINTGVFAIIGALGSKLGAQAVLSTSNTGVMGYVGNAGVGAAIWLATRAVLRGNKGASHGVLIGTVIQILLRAMNDYTPLGSYVAQLGMGDYQAQSFVSPQVLVDPVNSAAIQIPSQWAPRIVQAAPAQVSGPAMAGMSGLYGGGGRSLYGG